MTLNSAIAGMTWKRAQLEAQLLAQQRADDGAVAAVGVSAYSAPIASRSTLAGGREQLGPAAAQAEREVGAVQAADRVVAGDHARAARRRADQRLDQLGGVRVEVGGRLVEQQQLGVVQDRAGDRGALDHPARVGVDRVVGAAAQADGVQQLLDARVRRAVQAGVEAQVLARGEVAVEQRRVAEEADPAADRPALVGQLVAEHASRCRRAGAAAWRARAAASSCRRRWGRRRRASRPASSVSETSARASRSP